MSSALPIHRRNHRHGGPDPVGVDWEDVGGGGGAGYARTEGEWTAGPPTMAASAPGDEWLALNAGEDFATPDLSAGRFLFRRWNVTSNVWNYIGGKPFRCQDSGPIVPAVSTNNVWVEFPTTGAYLLARFPVAWPGVYDLEFGLTAKAGPVSDTISMGVAWGTPFATRPNWWGAATAYPDGFVNLHGRWRYAPLDAGTTFNVFYRTGSLQTADLEYYWYTVTPIEIHRS